ncbi:MAG: DUF6473 family protein [Pseudomonadota bacterium]
MRYEPGRSGLDYLPCRYGASKVLFRGPKRPLDMPYIACLGGAETYGRFVERPFPDRLEDALGLPCVNLGCLNAGIDVFAQDPHVPDIAAGAQVTIIQVVPAQNMSNRLYAVHPRRNDRFLKPSVLLQTIYRDVDFAEFNFNKHMLMRLHDISAERFEAVKAELREVWVARMRMLLRRIGGKTVLLWLADRGPDTEADEMGSDPWFIGRAEIEAVRADVTEVVEVVASPEALTRSTEEMIFAELDRPAAERTFGPAVHLEAASALAPVLAPLV